MEINNRIKIEKEYLEKIKKIIIAERAKQIDSLKRIPKEYKGRYADVKWGDEDLVKNLTDMCVNRLKIIDGLENSPYFGSFDFAMLGEELKRFRLGKTDIFDNNNLEVLDWRNPICTLYYDHSIGPVSYRAPQGEIHGELAKKSQILIQEGQIKSIRDVDLVSDDELLQPYLNVNADSRMKIIIASIQAEQNSIIRKPITQNLIIQGVAGSGKTSVALHRIAYLLYNCGKTYDASKFLVIGPNKYFLNYVSSILPDLDTQAVREYTFEEIAQEVIGEDNYTYETSNEELHRYLRSNHKNDSIKKIKGTLQYKEALNKFLKDYFEKCLLGGVKYRDFQVISENILRDRINPNFGYANNIKLEISQIVKKLKEEWEEIYYGSTKSLLEEMKKYPLRSKEREQIINEMDGFKMAAQKGFATEIRKQLKPLFISPINLYKLFLENIEKYITFSDDELKAFKVETLSMLKKKIIPYEDLAAISYLTTLYDGQKDYESYRQVVIDEAQDYNLFQFDVLKSLFRKSNFSIFGDLAQAIYSYRSIQSWEDVNTQIFDNRCEILEMSKSYRTTKEITNISNLILNQLKLSEASPVIRTGEDVGFIQLSNEEKGMFYVSKLSEFIEKGYKSIGIICKTEEEMTTVAEILNQNKIPFNFIKSSDKEYSAGICLLTSYLAKGLEFDGVIVNEASENNYNSDSPIDMHLLYVASTRALHEMIILHENALCNAFGNDFMINQKTTNKAKILSKRSNI